MASQKRNYVWVAVVVSIVVVASIGSYAFNVIRSPRIDDHEFDQATPWIIDPEHPWVDRGPRDFDYGQVPFVPSESRYSHDRVDLPHVPNPEATIPPEQRVVPEAQPEPAPAHERSR